MIYFQYTCCKKCYFYVFGILIFPTLMNIAKNLMKKYPFMIYFQNAFAVLIPSQVFWFGKPFSEK